MATWYTADDNSLWMAFGINVVEGTNVHVAPALWRYQIDLGQWMWHSGPNTKSDNSISVSDDFSFDNYPGGRWGPFCTIDDDNNFWVFGGETNAINSELMYNDLWVFNRASGWKHLGGVKNNTEMLGDTTKFANGQFYDGIWPSRASYNSLVYAGNGMLAMLVGYIGPEDYNYMSIDEDWYYDIATNQWARTYSNPAADPPAVANVLNTPDESTRPGGLYYTRTTSRGKIWAIGDDSKAVMVKDLEDGLALCELKTSICHGDAMCTSTGCVCKEGYEGTGGKGPDGCTKITRAPGAAPASTAGKGLSTNASWFVAALFCIVMD